MLLAESLIYGPFVIAVSLSDVIARNMGQIATPFQFLKSLRETQRIQLVKRVRIPAILVHVLRLPAD